MSKLTNVLLNSHNSHVIPHYKHYMTHSAVPYLNLIAGTYFGYRFFNTAINLKNSFFGSNHNHAHYHNSLHHHDLNQYGILDYVKDGACVIFNGAAFLLALNNSIMPFKKVHPGVTVATYLLAELTTSLSRTFRFENDLSGRDKEYVAERGNDEVLEGGTYIRTKSEMPNRIVKVAKYIPALQFCGSQVSKVIGSRSNSASEAMFAL